VGQVIRLFLIINSHFTKTAIEFSMCYGRFPVKFSLEMILQILKSMPRKTQNFGYKLPVKLTHVTKFVAFCSYESLVELMISFLFSFSMGASYSVCLITRPAENFNLQIY